MTLKTTIEEINGKLCTVVRRLFDAEWVERELHIRKHVLLEHEQGFFMGARDRGEEYNKTYCPYIVTILDALPKYPKPEDARLMYRYMAEGIRLFISSKCYGSHPSPVIGINPSNHFLIVERQDENEGLRGYWYNGDADREEGTQFWFEDGEIKITHAINAETGERVDVAIEGDE